MANTGLMKRVAEAAERLRDEGKDFKEIADILNTEGVRKRDGGLITHKYVNTCVQSERWRTKNKKKSFKKPEMISIPIEEPMERKSSKVVALFGEREDVAELLKGLVNG